MTPILACAVLLIFLVAVGMGIYMPRTRQRFVKRVRQLNWDKGKLTLLDPNDDPPADAGDMTLIEPQDESKPEGQDGLRDPLPVHYKVLGFLYQHGGLDSETLCALVEETEHKQHVHVYEDGQWAFYNAAAGFPLKPIHHVVGELLQAGLSEIRNDNFQYITLAGREALMHYELNRQLPELWDELHGEEE